VGQPPPSSARMTPRRWIEYTIAILIGNAIYFWVLFPGLAPVAQHQPFRFDLGLALDFACCVIIYGAIRLGVAHAHRWNARRS
jgi:H+/gluconate symporter-like permease